jgi:hypothetical protein
VYTQTEIGALRSNRRIIVVTVLTCKSSPTSPLILDMAAFRGTVTTSIVGASTGDRAKLTCRNGVRTQLDRSYSISLVGRVG